jgi:3-methyl-2-oxobutanoate hydroxymethyltransferase
MKFELQDVQRRKRDGQPIVMVTAYDFGSARAMDAAGVDIVLVGDSAATTVLGLEVTRLVTLDEMLMLTRAVRRGLTDPLLVGDMPYGTYEDSNEQAIETARRFTDIGCDAVKLEGAGEMVGRVAAVIAAGIPVMGHVGLAPQALRPGEPGRVEARTADGAMRLLRDARALEAAGCFALIFEAVPAPVSERIVPLLTVPIIGIGAGVAADGQVLVTYDLLGMTDGHMPRFVKRYGELKSAMIEAAKAYVAEVRERQFPDKAHSYGMDAKELELLDKRLLDLSS